MSNNGNKLAGKVAVVTGASKGIGASIAKHLASEGASVVVNYASSKSGADKVVSEIKALGRRAAAFRASVDAFDDVAGMVSRVKAELGPISILINNAGIASRGQTIAETDPAEISAIAGLVDRSPCAAAGRQVDVQHRPVKAVHVNRLRPLRG